MLTDTTHVEPGESSKQMAGNQHGCACTTCAWSYATCSMTKRGIAHLHLLLVLLRRRLWVSIFWHATTCIRGVLCVSCWIGYLGGLGGLPHMNTSPRQVTSRPAGVLSGSLVGRDQCSSVEGIDIAEV